MLKLSEGDIVKHWHFNIKFKVFKVIDDESFVAEVLDAKQCEKLGLVVNPIRYTPTSEDVKRMKSGRSYGYYSTSSFIIATKRLARTKLSEELYKGKIKNKCKDYILVDKDDLTC